MTNPEISKLMKEMREAAEKATPGEWFHVENGRTNSILRKVPDSYGEAIALCQQKTEKSFANAAHIAQASPANILKLLDYFERLEK